MAALLYSGRMTDIELTPLEQQVKRVLGLLLAATALGLACSVPWRAFSIGWFSQPGSLPGSPWLAGGLVLALRVYPWLAVTSIGLGWLLLRLGQYRAAGAAALVFLGYALLTTALMLVYSLGLNLGF